MTIERSPSRPLASALALGALLLAASCSKAPDERPSFLLISIDTLRADHVGCYGYERDTTPHLDALAARGYRFDQCATVSENTLISHASMFTGLTAEAHGTTYVDDGRVLHDNYRTIAEDFRDAGYQTAGFNSHGAWLNEAYGMAQGFETFVHGHDDADVLLPKVEEWLEKRDRSKPFFVFLHLFDVHSDVVGRPYQAKPPHLGRWTSDYAGEFTDWETRKPSGSNFLNAVNAGTIELSPEDDRYLVDQYDEGLATLDERLGRFLDELDGEVKRTTWITVTSDHGEEFGEHGKYMHGTVFDGIQRVPLIVAPPEARLARRPLRARVLRGERPRPVPRRRVDAPARLPRDLQTARPPVQRPEADPPEDALRPASRPGGDDERRGGARGGRRPDAGAVPGPRRLRRGEAGAGLRGGAGDLADRGPGAAGAARGARLPRGREEEAAPRRRPRADPRRELTRPIGPRGPVGPTHHSIVTGWSGSTPWVAAKSPWFSASARRPRLFT